MQNVVAELQPSYPDLHWYYDVHATEFFPFTASASAVRGSGPDAIETLVLSIQCHRPEGERGKELVLYADITREDGSVLAESPRREITERDRALDFPQTTPEGLSGRDREMLDREHLNQAITSAVNHLERWLKEQSPLIEQELSTSWDAA
jgi:hypothetical protein